MMNNCSFAGNLANEPMYFEGIAPRVVFTLAVDHDGKPVDGQKKAEFLDFVAWRGVAEYIHKYCHKGDLLVVRSQARKREINTQDGEKFYRTEFHVESVDNVKQAKTSQEENAAEYN